MIKKHFHCGKERAPFKPSIKVICIPPVICCNSETRVLHTTFAVNPENYTGERNVVDVTTTTTIERFACIVHVMHRKWNNASRVRASVMPGVEIRFKILLFIRTRSLSKNFVVKHTLYSIRSFSFKFNS